jgi:ribosomal protein S16
LDAEAIQAWVAKGAQLSDTVRSLLKRGAAEAQAAQAAQASSPVSPQASSPVSQQGAA